jgi:hypothetical protein
MRLAQDLPEHCVDRLRVGDRGVQPVRQISIHDTWSALRFRPANK